MFSDSFFTRQFLSLGFAFTEAKSISVLSVLSLFVHSSLLIRQPLFNLWSRCGGGQLLRGYGDHDGDDPLFCLFILNG